MDTIDILRKRTASNLAYSIKNEYEIIDQNIKCAINRSVDNGEYYCNINAKFKYDENLQRIINEWRAKEFSISYYEGIDELHIGWAK